MCRAKNFSRAVALAQANADLGGEVVRLHSLWAAHLVALGQPEGAINHFVEAGATANAADAAIEAGSLSRAASLIDVLPLAEQERLSARLAVACQQAGNLQLAATYFVRAGNAQAAVHMFFDAGAWDDAHKVTFLSLPCVWTSFDSPVFCASHTAGGSACRQQCST